MIIISTTSLNKRKLQALHTKQHILDISVRLICEYGYDHVKISQICKEANISIGCFYHHYKAKSDLIIELYKNFDYAICEFVSTSLKGDNAIQNILSLVKYYAYYATEIGVDLVKQIYHTHLREGFEFSISESRDSIQVLNRLIEQGQHHHQITSQFTSIEITRLLLKQFRGITYTWCMCNGSSDLIEEVHNSFSILLSFLKCSLHNNK